jgi:hypothetical protein
MQSCGGPSEISSDIKGKYKFTYPSGQVEVLSMNEDNTFLRNIYSSERDFVNQSEPIYKNTGTWGSQGINLYFNNWLSICYLGRMIDSILPKPETSTLTDVSWYKANDTSIICIYDEPWYILKKIEN